MCIQFCYIIYSSTFVTDCCNIILFNILFVTLFYIFFSDYYTVLIDWPFIIMLDVHNTYTFIMFSYYCIIKLCYNYSDKIFYLPYQFILSTVSDNLFVVILFFKKNIIIKLIYPLQHCVFFFKIHIIPIL